METGIASAASAAIVRHSSANPILPVYGRRKGRERRNGLTWSMLYPNILSGINNGIYP